MKNKLHKIHWIVTCVLLFAFLVLLIPACDEGGDTPGAARRGFKWNADESRLEVYVDGTLAGYFDNATPYFVSATGGFDLGNWANVTQVTNGNTSVTLNNISGQITTTALTIAAAGGLATFTVTNGNVTENDIVLVNMGPTTYKNYVSAFVTKVANGSFNVALKNESEVTAANSTFSINYTIIDLN